MMTVYDVTSTYYVEGKEHTIKFNVLGNNEFQAYNNADLYLSTHKGVLRANGYPWHTIVARSDSDLETERIRQELLQPFAGSQ